MTPITTIENVSFSYDGAEAPAGAGSQGLVTSTATERRLVLNDVSFTAKQGEVTALVGPSGSGKSTVSKLAARFWDADAGRITHGGINIESVDPETLLKDYSVVLLDEATASQDVESESEVQEALSRLLADKTVLVIAHRMRTVMGANKVVVLDEGKVIESGTPQELLAANGLFARMVQLQSR